jgi:hypothetical protein
MQMAAPLSQVGGRTLTAWCFDCHGFVAVGWWLHGAGYWFRKIACRCFCSRMLRMAHVWQAGGSYNASSCNRYNILCRSWFGARLLAQLRVCLCICLPGCCCCCCRHNRGHQCSPSVCHKVPHAGGWGCAGHGQLQVRAMGLYCRRTGCCTAAVQRGCTALHQTHVRWNK